MHSVQLGRKGVGPLTVACVAACSAPAPRPAPIKNASKPQVATRVEGPLAFEGTCDDSAEFGKPNRINDRETISIVTCHVPGASEAELASTAYLVRRSSENRGTSQTLGTWTTTPEQSEYYALETVLRDVGSHATHVLVTHRKGGLDQIPEVEVADYLPDGDTWSKTRYRGIDVRVEVQASGAAARIVTCNLTPGGTYDQGKPCDQQQGATIKAFDVR